MQNKWEENFFEFVQKLLNREVKVEKREYNLLIKVI